MGNFKRHAQGSSPKFNNFGDLGLRAYKEQQDRIIQNLKEQNSQQQSYMQQQTQDLRGIGAKEIEHNRSLERLNEAGDQLALDNTKLRGKREVDAILGQAKEAGKAADFWKNFSTTYSKQYAKAGTDLIDIAETVQSNNQMDIIINDPKFKQLINETSVLNNISSHEQLKATLDAYRDKNISEAERNDIVGHVTDLGFRMNHKTKLALANRILKDWPVQHQNLREVAEEKGLRWNEETVGEFYYLRAREVLRQLNISPTSKAGKTLLKGVDEKQWDERSKLNGVSKANADQVRKDKLSETTKDLIGKAYYTAEKGNKISANGESLIEYNNTFNQRIIHSGTSWTFDSSGRAIEPVTRNPHHDFLTIMKEDIASGRFESKEQAMNHTLFQLTPGADVKFNDDGTSVVYSKKDTWVGRHPKLEGEFDKAWTAYEKRIATEARDDIKNRDTNAQLEIDRRTQLDPKDKNYLDLSDIEVIKSLKETYSDLPNTSELLGKFETFSQYNKNANIVNANLNELYKSNNKQDLEEYISYLPSKIRQDWENKLDQLEVLHRNGYDKQGLKDKARGYLREILGNDNVKVGSLNTAHYIDVAKAIEQDILFEFSNAYDADMPDSQMIAAMDKTIREKIDIGGNGSGIYRRDNSGLETRFLTFTDEEQDNIATVEDIESKLSGGPIAFNNLFNALATSNGKITIKNGGSEVEKDLISIDQADIAIRSISAGTRMPYNKTVDYIVKNQPIEDGRAKFTERDVWNQYFESVGITDRLPPGTTDWADYNLDKTEVVKVSTGKLSKSNKESVNVYTGLLENRVIEPGYNKDRDENVEGSWAYNQNLRERLGRFLFGDYYYDKNK